MIKLCDETIALPLKISFDTALKSGSYPDKWKRANVVPAHKEESKNILKNYRPISLLPVCGKCFEKCIYNSLYYISKANKGIGIIRRLYKIFPRASLVNIYRAFVRLHLDYGDIIYDNSSNATFSQMIESVQYNAALAIKGAIHGSSRDKLYQELCFESLHDRRWFRKLCFYYKIRHNLCPLYLTELLPIMKTGCYSLR